MKLIKTVKLQRVRHGDLDEGDDWKLDDPDFNYIQTKGVGIASDDELVIACDVDRYPPQEVTYTIEGWPSDRIIHADGVVVLRPSQIVIDESKIETRYI